MSHKHRYGDTDLLFAPPKLTGLLTTNLIPLGTPVAQEANFVVPADVFVWDTDIATTRAGFVAAFLGISEGRSLAGSEDAIDLELPINMDGTFDVPLTAPATLNIGNMLTLSKAAGNALLNTCEVSATKAHSIYVVVRKEVAAVSFARCRLINSLSKRFAN